MKTTKRAARLSIKEMSGDAIETTPIDCDWSTGYGETWESYETSECDKCGEILVLSIGGNEPHSDVDDESECDGHIYSAEGPMMNHFYALPVHARTFDCREAARKLHGLPLCIVEFTDGEHAGIIGLALTGGGMDLSWEICEAYMRLGFLPPSHFADVPAMCGRGIRARDKWIADGCIASCKVLANRAQSRIESIKRTLAWGRAHERKNRAEKTKVAS